MGSPEDAVAVWFGSLITGLLYGLLFPPLGAVGLSWIALTPLALALRSVRPARGVLVAALSTWIGAATVIPWVVPTLHDHFEKSWPFSVGFWLLLSAISLAPFYAPLLAAQTWAARRLPRVWAPLLFAAAWVGAEWLRMQLGLRSPWTRLGDAHFEAARFRQIADLFGVYGLSFVVALGNGVFAEVIACCADRYRTGRAEWRPALKAALIFVGLFSLALAYGSWRLATLERSPSRFEVAVVQGALPPELRWRRATAGRVLRRYGGLTRDLLRGSSHGDPDLIVWPENAIQTSPGDPIYGPPLLRLSMRAPLLVGAPRSEAGRQFNSAYFLSGGEVRGHYDKRRLLPFSETRPFRELGAFGERGDLDAKQYAAGTVGVLFDVAAQRVAPLICMEALYPDLAREAARSGATVLVVLSNDGWFRGRGSQEQHAAMVALRAVETRLPVIRATTTGISAVIGPDGAVVGKLGVGERGVLRVVVPLAEGGIPLYVRIGDAFAIGSLLIVCGAVAVAWRLPRNRRSLPVSRAGQAAGCESTGEERRSVSGARVPEKSPRSTT